MIHRTQLLLDKVDAYQQTGQWAPALVLCGKGFQDSLRRGRYDDLLEIVLRTAFIYRAMGERELSQEHFDLCLFSASANADPHRAARAQNGLGVLHQDVGELEAAQRYYIQARSNAETAGDRLTAGDVELNLGILANIRGDLREALKHYQTAFSAYDEIGHRGRLAKVLNNLGMLHIDLEEYDRAAEALDRGLNISRSISDLATEGIINTNRTELFVAMNRLDLARTSCDEAFEVASRLGDKVLKTDVLKCYGIIYRHIGKPHLAESHFQQAIRLAVEIENPLLEAEATRELFLVFRKEDRNREALQTLYRAHALFSGLNAKQDQAEIAGRLDQLEIDFLELVARWGESIEAKDRYTSGHCKRVADYACMIAEADGLPENDLTWFRMGAFLHDVGKTAVPEEILNKPGRLTDDERATIERHTIEGDEMLSTIEFPWDIRPMIRSHHERWDGKGYPDGLAGEAIPYPARIMKVADVFDALTTTRSYRDPLTAEQALQLMADDNGAFDPVLFDRFCQLLPKLVGNSPSSRSTKSTP